MSPLMRSVSGVRGIVGSDLTVSVVDRYVRAFGRLVTETHDGPVVLARDSRASGAMFARAATQALTATGIDVVDCGLIPTPTAQLAVEHHHAAGGIIVTASHNPIEWNALKFVGSDGLFLDAERANRVFAWAEAQGVDAPSPGSVHRDDAAIQRHIDGVLALEFVDVAAIRAAKFRVALDCVRGAGGVIMPELLRQMGCVVVGLDLETDGQFPRAPEPVPENLARLAELVRSEGADVGIAVDPDVDRLALVDEHAHPIGEDYTLALAVRAVLERRRGPVVVNLSTSLVVDDAARMFGVSVQRAPVGEANVAAALREAGAVIGGEGNGGVMLPSYHLGRDAPVAAALILDLLARQRQSVSALVAAQPRYTIVKAKSGVPGDLGPAYASLVGHFADAAVDRQDGLRLAWRDRWLHVRPSGTEPIVRLIAEAPNVSGAERLIATARNLIEEASH